MATVRFYAEDVPDLPDVCVKTGRPTTTRTTLRITYHPAWPILLAPLSLIAVAVGLLAGERRWEVPIPLLQGVERRYRRWRTLSFGVAGLGLAGTGIAGGLDNSAMGVTMFVVFILGITLLIGTRMLIWSSFSMSKDGSVMTVRRCHPAFFAAMKALDQQP